MRDRPRKMSRNGRTTAGVARSCSTVATRVGVVVTERRGDVLLMLERQLVLVAARGEVQGVAHLPQEVARREHARELALRHHALLHDLAQAAYLELDPRHPQRGVQVAQ